MAVAATLSRPSSRASKPILPLYSSPVLTYDGRRLPTVGDVVADWIEDNIRLGPGDFYGQPFRLTSFQRRWVHRLFEYYPENNEFRYKRATFGTAKGNGKTPFEGALGAEGMCGPTAPVSPLVLVAASALVQSNLVYGDLRAGMTHDDSPLKPFIEDFDLSIQFKDGSPGEIKRVAAVTGSNDGPRATRLLADELHEWTGRLASVFDVLDGAIGKRRNAFTVGISTAGSDLETLLGRMYVRGKAIASGEIIDDGTLFEWYETPDDVEIPEKIKTAADLKQWRKAIRFANPALAPGEGDFLTESYIRSRFDGAQQIERYKWLRYHCNRWTASEEQWLPPGRWEECRREPPANVLEPRAPVALAFCGDYEGASAALAAVSWDGLVVNLGCWEPPIGGTEAQKAEYEVPRNEVKAAVRKAMQTYAVKRFVVAPNGWHGEASDWVGEYGDKIVVEFDWSRQAKRKHDACSKFFTSTITKEVGHDGDETLARHLASAVPKETSEGTWIARNGRTGPPIVLAVSAVLGYDAMAALTRLGKRPKRLVTF